MDGSNNARPRGSEDIWLDAAYEVLTESGVEAVKVMPLAKSLGLTRTGFYWHFKDVGDFRTQMLSYWEEKAFHGVTEILESISDPVERLYSLGDLSVTPPTQHGGDAAEPAIRAWAQSDSQVNAAVQRVDTQRVAYLQDILKQLNLTNPDLARIIYASYIGLGTLSASDGSKNHAAMSTLLAAMLALRDA